MNVIFYGSIQIIFVQTYVVSVITRFIRLFALILLKSIKWEKGEFFITGNCIYGACVVVMKLPTCTIFVLFFFQKLIILIPKLDTFSCNLYHTRLLDHCIDYIIWTFNLQNNVFYRRKKVFILFYNFDFLYWGVKSISNAFECQITIICFYTV